MILNDILKDAKAASRVLSIVDISLIDKALEAIAKSLNENMDLIIAENKKDLENGKLKSLSTAMLERLELSKKKIEGICHDTLAVRDLTCPVDEIIETYNRPNGLKIDKVRVPFGVIGAIYESRPNVSVDISCLCLKTKNVCVLKGGSEAINSNRILVKLMRDAIKDFIPADSIVFIDSSDHEVVMELMTKKEYLDLLVPRGSKRLIQRVVENATVPVIETGAGNCHIYIDDEADIEMALNITYNAKMSRPSVCNAIEKIVVNEKIAKEFLPLLKSKLPNVELRGFSDVKKIIDCCDATEDDYYEEYNDFIATIKIVKNIEEAINHINKYSTKHSETIVTNNASKAQMFLDQIDSACVYHNVSTRFSDGGCFGFGAELGISTQKLHARGPMGLKEMTTYKYKIYGNGQVR